MHSKSSTAGALFVNRDSTNAILLDSQPLLSDLRSLISCLCWQTSQSASKIFCLSLAHKYICLPELSSSSFFHAYHVQLSICLFKCLYLYSVFVERYLLALFSHQLYCFVFYPVNPPIQYIFISQMRHVFPSLPPSVFTVLMQSTQQSISGFWSSCSSSTNCKLGYVHRAAAPIFLGFHILCVLKTY